MLFPEGREGLEDLDGRLGFDGLEEREGGLEGRFEGLEGRFDDLEGDDEERDGRLIFPRFCVLLLLGAERRLERWRDGLLLRCGRPPLR